ncbi:MAG: magnesium chelatase, partial [Syntrophomonadaceae bacterium]
VRMINDVDSRGSKEGILSFKGRKNKKDESDPEYFQQVARPLKDMHRGELVHTEKTLTPGDF